MKKIVLRNIKGIIYLDAMHNKVWCKTVDSEELQEEFDGDVYDYADAYAPSNSCEWMMVNDETKFECDEVKKETFAFISTCDGEVYGMINNLSLDEAIDFLKDEYDDLVENGEEVPDWESVKNSKQLITYNERDEKVIHQIVKENK